MTNVVYDAGALIAADRNDRRMWAAHRIRLEHDMIPVAPTVVIAHVSRSSRQVQLRRFLRGCEVVALTESLAHETGALLATSTTNDVIDAVVVIEAVRRSAVIVTSDRYDIARLVDALGAGVDIIDT